MVSIFDEFFRYILMPTISAQLLLMVLIYLVIVKNRIFPEYKLYGYFLASFIVLLIGRALQEFVDIKEVYEILYVRMAVLFTIGVPSLFVACAIRAGIKQSRYLFVLPYLFGACISLIYTAFMDAVSVSVFFNLNDFDFLPFTLARSHALAAQIFGMFVLLIVPCCYFLFNEFNVRRDKKALAFIGGALTFGLLFAVGSIWPQIYSIYYIGSIVPAYIWCWAIFHDVRDMKGKSAALKDELEFALLMSDQIEKKEVDKLFTDLSEISHGDLAVYKHRIRGVLARLTDRTIEIGGDSTSLLLRNIEQNKAIENSTDSEDIKKIAYQEARHLSALMADIPVKQVNKLVEKAKAFIQQNYSEEIDVDSIANHLNVSRSYLMRTFKKETEQTINQYLTHWRIELAKQLLLENSVTDTAFSIGFNNSNYFSTVFKKSTGSTPGKYQQNAQKEL